MSVEKVELDEVLDALGETAEELLDLHEGFVKGVLERDSPFPDPDDTEFAREAEENLKRWFSILRRAGRDVAKAERFGLFIEFPVEDRN